MSKIRLALFASGSGSNAINIIDHFNGHSSVEIAFVLSNKKDAPVIEKSQMRSVETIILSNDLVSQGQVLIDICKEKAIDFVILAGYLRLIPSDFIHYFHERIINIHPSLLPKFGGQGMYGDHVHNAVLNTGEKETGISIHFVDEDFDQGRLIAQFYCPVNEEDTLDTIKNKIQQLEHSYFPVVIEKTVLNIHHD
jgi:phosphoribosylglycinamide formyltransferase-1